MTQVVSVSQREMEKQTGFKKALGYALPKEDKILIRKNLSKDIKKKVLAHEEEHILKGEEGPGWLKSLIGGALTIFGGPVGAVVGGAIAASGSSSTAKKAAATAASGSEREIEFARESRDLARGDVEPYREAGYTALDALMSMTGLGGGRSGGGIQSSGGPGGVVVNGVRNDDLTLGPRIGQYGIRQTAYGRPGGASANSQRQYNRFEGGPLYNVNELGPESVYQNGSYTRSGLPQTIPPNPTGYVAPNIQGRQGGGDLLPYQPPPNIMNPPRFEPDVSVGNDTGKYGLGDFYGTYSQNLPPKYGNRRGPGTTVDNNTGLPVGGGMTPEGASILGRIPSGSTGAAIDSTSLPGSAGGGGFAGAAMNYGQTGIAPFGNQGYADGGAPRENPGGVEGGYNFMTDPGYNFRIGEGQRALERSAAARGGLLSGGYGRKLTRYAQDYASNEYTNVYNRISNIAQLGQVANQQGIGATMQAGGQMGTAAAQSAYATAAGQQASGNAWTNFASNIDWAGVGQGIQNYRIDRANQQIINDPNLF